MFEQALGVGILLCSVFIAQHARHQASDRVDQHQRGELTPGQNVIPDRDLIGREMFPHPLINPLVAAADQRQSIVLRQLAGHCLVEHPTLWREQNNRRAIDRLGEHRLHRLEDRPRFHYHAAPTPISDIVGRSVAVLREFPQVM